MIEITDSTRTRSRYCVSSAQTHGRALQAGEGVVSEWNLSHASESFFRLRFHSHRFYLIDWMDDLRMSGWYRQIVSKADLGKGVYKQECCSSLDLSVEINASIFTNVRNTDQKTDYRATGISYLGY